MTLLRGLVLSLSLALGACSSTCSNTSVEGLYTLTFEGLIYSLQLKSSGVGALSVAGKSVGELRWKLIDANGQAVELEMSGEVYTAMRKLTAFAEPISGTVKVTSGVIAAPAECSGDGHLKRLLVNNDQRIEFLRSEEGRATEQKGPPISWPVSSKRTNFSLLMRSG